MKEKQKLKYLIKVGSHSNLNFLLETDSLEEAKEEIQKYINNNINQSFYSRVIFYEEYIWIDYGSWTNFVYVYFKNINAKREYVGEEVWKILNKR